MKPLLILFFTLMLATILQAQGIPNRCGAVFNKANYPRDSFSVKEQIYTLGSTKIVLTILHHDYLEKDKAFSQIWIAQSKDKKILKSKYLGYEGDESGIQVPNKQPLADYFIVNAAGEFSGMFYLISSNGAWYEIPGGSLYLNTNKSRLFTYVPAECGGCKIARFDLKSKKMFTKLWDSEGTAWEEIKPKSSLINVFENSKWLKWE